jgi:hypothetical protein
MSPAEARPKTATTAAKIEGNNPMSIPLWHELILVVVVWPEMLCEGFPLDQQRQTGIMTRGFAGLNPL